MVMNLATGVGENFRNAEEGEKRRLLKFELQNLY
jgi:hypothetical protein